MKTTSKLPFVIIANLLALVMPCSSQPFIDILNVQYVNSPDYGLINQKKNATRIKHFSIQGTIPFQFKNKTHTLIVSPEFEMWSPQIESANRTCIKQYGLLLPVSFLKTLNNPDWSIISTIIIRRNGYALNMKDNWQVGGAVLVNFKANENLNYKLGIYANTEFSGVFIMPLLGIDWQISKKTNLSGILPGCLTLEHKLYRKIYTGASFRAITNSYRQDTGYWRIDENRLGIFIDYYLTKNIVLNTGAGHSILRKIRSGTKDKFKIDWLANDNIYIKVSLAYLLRFR
jgi:hypothetical protein